MKVFLGACSNHEPWQQIALALYEDNALAAYHTSFADNYRTPIAKMIRRWLGRVWPALDRQLQRRRIRTIPEELIETRGFWEIVRTLATKIGLGARPVDWLFARVECGLDQDCAQRMAQPQVGAFMGVEHGSLLSIRAAHRGGKKSIVTFVSPHHAFREKWVDTEYEKFPELLTPATRRLLDLGRIRDERRDREAAEADCIVTLSHLVTQTLIDAGFSKEKIVTVPLGSPAPATDFQRPGSLNGPIKFIFAGAVSVGKGAHYLLDAWRQLNASKTAELHFYGSRLLPDRCVQNLPPNTYFHGSVPREKLFEAFQTGSILIFPTLCDGFGTVVTEAMAHRLPVITTPNAGASSLIEEGRNGFLIAPANPAALAVRMQWCLNHLEELRAMRLNAQTTAQGFTWEDFRISFRERMRPFLNNG